MSPMRVGVLLCLLAASICAQDKGGLPDPYVGVFQNDQISLTLAGSGGKYSGAVTFQGRTFPVTARTVWRVTTGTVEMDGRGILLTFSPYAGGLQVAAEGAVYKLERVTPTAPKVPGASPRAAEGIVGEWRNAQGSARFNADGTGAVDGNPGRYEIHGNELTLTGEGNGGAPVRIVAPFEIDGDILRLTIAGAAITLNRVRETSGAAGVRPEMVGKWCWVSVVNAQQGARTSNQCFVLGADGSYRYSGETDSYNPYGGAATQQGDSGSWTATETTFTARSRTRGTTVYTLQKRNHPKTGDPMLVLNGQPYVTYFKHASW